MAVLPVIKRFLTEDFPEEKEWIGKLFYPLNLLLNTIYTALSNGITIAQNLFAQQSVQAVSGSSPSVSFQYKFSPQVPVGISIINLVTTNSTPLTGAVSCAWSISGSLITVTVYGLPKSGTYSVTFLVWGG